MSKYNSLWNYIVDRDQQKLEMTFKDIADVTGSSIDHSFLTYKKELLSYGFAVEKISMKMQTVVFVKI